MRGQTWIHSPNFDALFILAPPFASVGAVVLTQVLAPSWLQAPLRPSVWLLIIVGIDVAHVYATSYRSYLLDRVWRTRPRLLSVVPVLGFVGSWLAYRWDSALFWRLLAYLAIFHFVRQPYGLMMYYKRFEKTQARWDQFMDRLAIYTASLYPLILWHLDAGRNFAWFVPGDMWIIQADALKLWVQGMALLVALLYGIKEIRQFLADRWINLPKNMVLLGTSLAFWSGIMGWNSDYAFTLTNVISHGIPYLALIWVYNGAAWWRGPGRRPRPIWIAASAFLGSLLLLGYAEEGLWDVLVWTEHRSLFPWFYRFFHSLSDSTLDWVVPLLALPQLTHYILDGFLWKLSGAASNPVEITPCHRPQGAHS